MQDSGIKYTPIPVLDLLKEIKDLSEIMVNLAYCSIFFPDEKIYSELEKIEDRIDYLKSILIMQTALATRDKDDAERLVSIFDLAIGIDKMNDVSSDIAQLAKKGLRIRMGKYIFLRSPTNLIYAIEVIEDSPLNNLAIQEIYNSVKEIFDVVAVRRGERYILSPEEDFVIREGDIVFVKGLAENIEALLDRLGLKREIEGLKIAEESILDTIHQLKNISEVMIDLAYASLFAGSLELALEIENLEEYLDEMTAELKVSIMELGGLTSKEKLAMIEFVDACEYYGDAAMDMTYSLRKGLKPHPIIEMVLEQTDERYQIIKIGKKFDGKILKDLELSKYGVDILALKRGSTWYVTPPSSGWKLKEGDILIIQYYEEAEEYIKELLSEVEESY